MTEPRQKPIPVTSEERKFLDQQKQRYEKKTGDSGDWGQFLGSVVLLGLAAAGIYALAKAINRTPESVNVQCPMCSSAFVMALPTGVGQIVYIRCPHCQSELVVNLSGQ